jgi:Protein of unknown function (DUF3499)
MTRQCARPGCGAAAAATLAYDYQQRTSWLDPLAPEAHPMSYDLCAVHADTLVVPRGWRLDDRRHGLPTDHRPSDRRAAPAFEGAFAL